MASHQALVHELPQAAECPSISSRPQQAQGQSAQLLKQPVGSAQSVELVQTLVCATVSTIASLRCIFPEDCFKTCFYDIEDLRYSYKDFMAAAHEASQGTERARKRMPNRYVPWEILVRGSNSGVDKLLDWIELGAADALSHKYLKSLQLGIYNGNILPSNRLEAYAMNFSYAEDNMSCELHLSQTTSLLASLAGKTLDSAKKELRLLVHRLATHIGGFSTLPPDCIVHMHFTYNDSCPFEYQPPGFISCHDQSLLLQSDDGAHVGEMNPGPHRVSLRVFLNEPSIEVYNSPAPLAIDRLSSPFTRLHYAESTTVANDGPVDANEMKLLKADTALTVLKTPKHDERRASLASNDSEVPSAQERKQLVAIAAMARLRTVADDTCDTQLLDVATSQLNLKQGSIDLDGASSIIDGSSTQGTPNTIRTLRPRKSSSVVSKQTQSEEPLAVLRPRKRRSIGEDNVTHKICKISKAGSPFATASLRQ